MDVPLYPIMGSTLSLSGSCVSSATEHARAVSESAAKPRLDSRERPSVVSPGLVAPSCPGLQPR